MLGRSVRVLQERIVDALAAATAQDGRRRFVVRIRGRVAQHQFSRESAELRRTNSYQNAMRNQHIVVANWLKQLQELSASFKTRRRISI